MLNRVSEQNMRRSVATRLLLLACLKPATAYVTVRYLPGCPDSTADNYYPANPTGDQTDCVYAPTLYCPDANADNYESACELLTPAHPALSPPAARSARPLRLAVDTDGGTLDQLAAAQAFPGTPPHAIALHVPLRPPAS